MLCKRTADVARRLPCAARSRAEASTAVAVNRASIISTTMVELLVFMVDDDLSVRSGYGRDLS